jgi:hypothetical protein
MERAGTPLKQAEARLRLSEREQLTVRRGHPRRRKPRTLDIRERSIQRRQQRLRSVRSWRLPVGAVATK